AFHVTGVQTCALPIFPRHRSMPQLVAKRPLVRWDRHARIGAEAPPAKATYNDGIALIPEHAMKSRAAVAFAAGEPLKIVEIDVEDRKSVGRESGRRWE